MSIAALSLASASCHETVFGIAAACDVAFSSQLINHPMQQHSCKGKPFTAACTIVVRCAVVQLLVEYCWLASLQLLLHCWLIAAGLLPFSCCCTVTYPQDEGWKPSITVKQILLGIQVGIQGAHKQQASLHV